MDPQQQPAPNVHPMPPVPPELPGSLPAAPPVGIYPQAAPIGGPLQPVNFGEQKVPLSVQIFYVLAVIGLVVGVLALLVILFLGTQAAHSSFSGFGGLIFVIALALVALVGFMFFLAVKIRAGRKWALIVYSVILGISLLSNLIGHNSRSIGTSISGELVTTVLVVLMWTRDRHYFR